MTRHALAAVLLIAAPALARDDLIPPAAAIGTPVSCISTAGMRSAVRNDRVIDFTVAGRTYRNTLPHACPGLGFDRSFAYTVPQPRLCDVDVITVLQSPGISAGARCGLGMFQPVGLSHRRR